MKRINVLLIEDNPDEAELIQRSLAKLRKDDDYTVHHCTRLTQGLDWMKNGNVDVMLLDLNLPDGLGLSTLERACSNAPLVPIIVLTGNDDYELGISAVQKGAQDYLIKGEVTDVMLGRSIRYAIERKKLLAQLEQSAKEIKTLRGFLPICSHCKKIRDDKGYWTQVDEYVSKHTEAEFSHGICPDCAIKIYPKYFKKA